MTERPSGLGGMLDIMNPVNSRPVQRLREGTRDSVDSLLNLPYSIMGSLIGGTRNLLWNMVKHAPIPVGRA